VTNRRDQLVPDANDPKSQALDSADEPPVVARLVVEIRSDGTRTIARGAAEDAASGERVAIQIAGSNPLELALSLVKTIGAVPSLAKNAVAALRGPRRP
jgi:hypothetical protein